MQELAERYHVNMPLEELYAEANKWELSHGGLSGRTASQFITHLMGTREDFTKNLTHVLTKDSIMERMLPVLGGKEDKYGN